VEGAGLVAYVSTVDGPACAVIDQDPNGGELVQPGSTVSLVFEGTDSCPL